MIPRTGRACARTLISPTASATAPVRFAATATRRMLLVPSAMLSTSALVRTFARINL